MTNTVTLEDWDWAIVLEALALYSYVNRWQDQGHNTSDIEEVSYEVFAQTSVDHTEEKLKKTAPKAQSFDLGDIVSGISVATKFINDYLNETGKKR